MDDDSSDDTDDPTDAEQATSSSISASVSRKPRRSSKVSSSNFGKDSISIFEKNGIVVLSNFEKKNYCSRIKFGLQLTIRFRILSEPNI